MPSTTIHPYLINIPDWKTLIKEKWILFDTDSIVTILEYRAEKLFDEFEALDVTNCYIHSVQAELLRTNSNAGRALRASVFTKYKFTLFPLKEEHFKQAVNLQSWLAAIRTFPAPTDLYLGGTLATFPHNKVLLLTSNLKDFPCPLFNREAHLICQNNVSSKTLTFLSLNHQEFDQA